MSRAGVVLSDDNGCDVALGCVDLVFPIPSAAGFVCVDSSYRTSVLSAVS